MSGMPILGSTAALVPTPLSLVGKTLRDEAEVSERRADMSRPTRRGAGTWLPASPVTTCSDVWGWGGREGASSSPLGARRWCFFVKCRKWSRKWWSSGSRAGGRAAGWGGQWAAGRRGQGSVEATAPKVFGDDDVRHGVKDKLDVVGVGGTGDVGVDLLVG